MSKHSVPRQIESTGGATSGNDSSYTQVYKKMHSNLYKIH